MTSSHVAKTFGTSMIWIGMIIVATCLFFIFGPELEKAYLPVLKDMDMVQTTAPEPDMIGLIVSGRKVRSCKYLETTVAVRKNGLWEKGTPSFKVAKGSPTYPTGQQSFGTWFVKPEGEQIKFEIRYECHPLWDSVTELPIWERP